MRLINTETLTFRDFFESQIPSYAILSHRWGEREVTYKEFKKRTMPACSGLVKIEKFCRLAAERGFEWCWIDTCCIDKRSSAELTEAINSMFRWYASSSECYVYLSDVTFNTDELPQIEVGDTLEKISEEQDEMRERFCRSSWFRRGWTLQELLAPRKEKTIFFDASWHIIAALPQLAMSVSRATGIRKHFLDEGDGIQAHRSRSVSPPCIAEKMSWASRRVTSIGEDMAYCLLGLFSVNMPLLYGEGEENAFFRLQVEIMKASDDESLFAWTSSQPYSGMLAARPSFFANSRGIRHGLKNTVTRPPYMMTNKGLEFAIPKVFLCLDRQDFPCFLSVTTEDGKWNVIGVHLRRNGNEIYRVNCGKLELDPKIIPMVIGALAAFYFFEFLKNTQVVHIRSPIEPA